MEQGLIAKYIYFFMRFCFVMGIIGIIYGAMLFIGRGKFVGLNSFLNKSYNIVDALFTKGYDVDSFIIKKGRIGALIIIIASIGLVVISNYLSRQTMILIQTVF